MVIIFKHIVLNTEEATTDWILMDYEIYLWMKQSYLQAAYVCYFILKGFIQFYAIISVCGFVGL